MTKRLTLILSALLVAIIGTALLPGNLAAQAVTVKNYFARCAGTLPCDNVLHVSGSADVDSGGEIDFESGSALKIVGTDRTADLATAPAAVAAGYKIARGTVTLDGSNPSSATTGLATIASCAVTNKRSTTPALDPSTFTIATAAVAGRLDVYAWKVTGAGDTTLIASTDSDDTVDWICVGT